MEQQKNAKAKTMQVLIAGFGGQGVLFAGKFLAYLGMIGERQVSWLPSYGPEMRGGTANCSVILSSAPIGSPIVSAPDAVWTFRVNETGFVAGDGIRLSAVRPEDVVTVTRSERKASFIRFHEQNVFELIQRKLS